RALAKHPSERPGSAVALIDEVAEALAGVDLARLGPPPPAPATDGPPADTTIAPVVVGSPQPRRGGRARMAATLAAGALAGIAVTAAVALLTRGDEAPARLTVAAPAALPGAVVLGSDLRAAGRAVDCRGAPVRDSSIGCTLAQSRLPRATLVVAQDGVVRRWAVRSARGELALSVLRPRAGGFFQIALSRSEFVGNDGVYLFATELAVERGDVLAVRVLPGAGIGVRGGVAGAATDRWIPRLKGTPRAPRAGVAAELLLRAELLPGREPAAPPQVTGAAAAALPAGRVVRSRRARYNDGRAVDIAVVDLPGHVALDLRRDGRRVARQELPDFRPGDGRVITLEVEPDEETEAEQVGVFVEYANAGSARILSHYVVAYGREFQFVN
ncbi:MAG: hypothetical protein QOG42_2076, partial [Solirubrobacteraceae bacterium]|nr:hypothetical protein [Solirubrobacteraceae bacterium]